MDDLKQGQIEELQRARRHTSLEGDGPDHRSNEGSDVGANHRTPVQTLEQRQADALEKIQASNNADSSASAESSVSSLEQPSLLFRPGAIAVLPADRLRDGEEYRRSELTEEVTVEQVPYLVEAAVVDEGETEVLRQTLKEQENKMKELEKTLSKYKGSKVIKAVAVNKTDELMSRREERALRVLTGQPLSRDYSIASLISRNSSNEMAMASCCVIQ